MFNLFSGVQAMLVIVVVVLLLFCFSSNISNTRDSVSSGYPNTKKRVENTMCDRVFLTRLEVFGYNVADETLRHGHDFICFNLMNS